MAASVVRRPHFQTGISLQPASRSQLNFIFSMSLMRDCLHFPFRTLVAIVSELIGPIGLLWENACEQRSVFIYF